MRAGSRITSLGVLGLFWVTRASGQAQSPPTPQFDFQGFIQEATLDTTNAICTPVNDPVTQRPSDALRGGTITVNGIKMIVPCNTLLQLPANTMTWGDLFDPAKSAPVGSYIGAPGTPVPANPVAAGAKTGLALADQPSPFPSFEVRVQGNVVGKNADGSDRYVVGFVAPIAQHALNVGSGLVSYVDHAIGAFRVGGLANDPQCASRGITSPSCSGSLVQINDPAGRWGLPHSPDPRFSGDNANSTVRHSTGIPMCIPRVAPAPAPAAGDPDCPLGNRPLNGDFRFPVDPFLAPGAPLRLFDMPPPPGQPGADASGFPDATKQVPLMVGDQVVYSGTLYKIDATVPGMSAANTYVSAHTVEDVTGIFTAPGVPPAYVYVEEFLIGSDGAAVQGILQEASTRLTVVGATTDPTRLVEINALDVNPCTGVETPRLLATTDPATQPVRGRFVHRVLGGLFMPPTRNYRMVSQTQARDPVSGKAVDIIAANGFVTGQFSLPNFEYIFPENHRFGDPLLPMNFQDLPFLASGSGPLAGPGTGATSPTLGALDPWPGSTAPPKVSCAGGAAPIVTFANPNLTTGTGTAVTLSPNVTRDANSTGTTYLWTQTGGARVALAGAATPSISFTAPSAPGALTFQLSVTDQFGTGAASATVNVTSSTDVVRLPAAATWATQNGKRGGFGKLSVTATSSDTSGAAVLTLEEVAIDGTTVSWGTGAQSPPGTFNWVESKGAPQPQLLNVYSSKGGFYQAHCGAAGANGAVTCN